MDETEALRRRLYRPDASDDDRARYAQLVPRAVPVSEAPSDAGRRRRVPSVLVLGAVVLALAIVALAVRAIAAPEHAVARLPAAPSASAIAAAGRVTVGPDGLAKPGEPVHGTGTVEVAIDVTGASFDGGRFSVLLSSTDERPVGWSAVTLATRRDWSSYRKPVGAGPARDRLAATRPDEIAYRDSPPRWVTVEAPADAAWTLTVGFAGGRVVALP
ncbi:MAG: hypothetical protein HIU86_01925 [Acidobacteria bacterium]|nr:hypothetical protein [Acidobacteriota bacterium]